MRQYKAALFDFDGVLCKGHFYAPAMAEDYPEIGEWIQKNIFQSENRELVRAWMRGKMTWQEVNGFISQKTGIDRSIIDKKLIQSIEMQLLNNEVLSLAKKLKSSGVRIGIVTDNMDIFSSVSVPQKQLADIFDVILNSADYGLLKRDDDGRLFEYALEKIGVGFADSAFIDDNAANVELFHKKGGEGILYKN